MRFDIEKRIRTDGPVVGVAEYRWIIRTANHRIVCFSRWYFTRKIAAQAARHFRKHMKDKPASIKGDDECSTRDHN